MTAGTGSWIGFRNRFWTMLARTDDALTHWTYWPPGAGTLAAWRANLHTDLQPDPLRRPALACRARLDR